MGFPQKATSTSQPIMSLKTVAIRVYIRSLTRVVFPLPLATESAAVSTSEANAPLMNLDCQRSTSVSVGHPSATLVALETRKWLFSRVMLRWSMQINVKAAALGVHSLDYQSVVSLHVFHRSFLCISWCSILPCGLGIHRNTVLNRIKRGELEVERVREHNRDRVYVLLDTTETQPDVPALAVALERIRGLEELVDQMRGTVDFERERYASLLNDIKNGSLALPAPSRPWWRVWG